MNDHTIILLCGMYSLGFAVFHVMFSKIFGWKEELEKLSANNKAIMQILNRRLIYFFVFVAAACFIFPEELSTTTFGHFFLIGMSLFWLGRTVEQVVYVKSQHPLAQLLTYLFIIGTILFAIPVLI